MKRHIVALALSALMITGCTATEPDAPLDINIDGRASYTPETPDIISVEWFQSGADAVDGDMMVSVSTDSRMTTGGNTVASELSRQFLQRVGEVAVDDPVTMASSTAGDAAIEITDREESLGVSPGDRGDIPRVHIALIDPESEEIMAVRAVAVTVPTTQ